MTNTLQILITMICLDDDSLTLSNYLPKNVEILERIGYDVCDRAKFIQKSSLAPVFEETKGIQPIFVVPAAHHFLLEPLTRKLMYPVFCALLSKNPESVRQTATELFEVIAKQ